MLALGMVLLGIVYVVAHIASDLSEGRLSAQIVERKLWHCYMRPEGIFIAAACGVVLCSIGWRAIRASCAAVGLWTVAKQLSLIAAVNAAVGNILFYPIMLSHAMLRAGLSDYFRVMTINMLLSGTPTMLIILKTNPSRLVPKTGLLRTVAWVCAMLIFGYLCASLVYVASFGGVLVE